MKLLREIRNGKPVNWIGVSEKHGHAGSLDTARLLAQHGQVMAHPPPPEPPNPKPTREPDPGREWAQDEKGNWGQVTKGFAAWGQSAAHALSHIIGPPRGCGGCGGKR